MGTSKFMPTRSRDGIETVASPRTFAESIAHFESVLAARGLTLFAKIDFSGDAKKAGLDMLPTMLLVFGNPKAGTPVMVAAATAALDLPLKVLFSQDSSGKVSLHYNTPDYLAERHAIPAELVKHVAGVRALVEAAVAPAP
jgi:uncharacterized protein (DUF302 family)